MLTPKEAKELTLEVWRYLRDHPEIKKKSEMPYEIYKKVEDCQDTCPLCEYFTQEYEGEECKHCPIGVQDGNDFNCKYYNKWSYFASNTNKRQQAAKIVELVEAWEVEDAD